MDQNRVKPQQDSLLKSRIKSFQYAVEGWKYVFQNEPNIWIHSAVLSIVVVLGAWLQINRTEWAILVLTFLVILMAEFVNTAIEAIVDMTMPDIHPLAKAAKDVAAGSVFLGALGAVIIGLLILGPPLWEKIV